MSVGEAIAYALAAFIAVFISLLGFLVSTAFFAIRFLLVDPYAPLGWALLLLLFWKRARIRQFFSWTPGTPYADAGQPEPRKFDERNYQHTKSQQSKSSQQEQHDTQSDIDRASADPTFDPYSCLEVAKNASREAILAAYRRKMKVNHPDVVTGSGLDQAFVSFANERAKEIQRAYDTIMSRIS